MFRCNHIRTCTYTYTISLPPSFPPPSLPPSFPPPSLPPFFPPPSLPPSLLSFLPPSLSFSPSFPPSLPFFLPELNLWGCASLRQVDLSFQTMSRLVYTYVHVCTCTCTCTIQGSPQNSKTVYSLRIEWC